MVSIVVLPSLNHLGLEEILQSYFISYLPNHASETSLITTKTIDFWGVTKNFVIECSLLVTTIEVVTESETLGDDKKSHY